jgi:hypothetical protein
MGRSNAVEIIKRSSAVVVINCRQGGDFPVEDRCVPPRMLTPDEKGSLCRQANVVGLAVGGMADGQCHCLICRSCRVIGHRMLPKIQSLTI